LQHTPACSSSLTQHEDDVILPQPLGGRFITAPCLRQPVAVVQHTTSLLRGAGIAAVPDVAAAAGAGGSVRQGAAAV
jgi:hypothetical protein